jgi:hypothetical protein
LAEVTDHKGVTVSRLACGVFHADRAGRTGLAFDDDRLTPGFAKLFAHDARHQIRTAAGGVSHRQFDGFIGKGLRLRARLCAQTHCSGYKVAQCQGASSYVCHLVSFICLVVDRVQAALANSVYVID